MKANHGEKSWDTFEFLRRFPIHTYPAPPLTPQTKLEACFQIFFSPEFQFCIGWGEGELQENFEKDVLFYGSLCTDNPHSPPIFTEGRGGGGPEITESYEYYHE